MNSKISYYELLGWIRDKRVEDLPNRLRITIARKSRTYFKLIDEVDNSFTCYFIENDDEVNQTFEPYLRDCLLDVSSFDKCIEVID